jgi:hypothetical protein
MPSIYIVQAPNFPVFKLGFWKGEDIDLWSRYRTPYGKNIDITLWNCKRIQDEKKAHADLAQFADPSSSELYKMEHLEPCFTYLNLTFGSHRVFNVSEYREQKAEERKQKIEDRKEQRLRCGTVFATKQNMERHQDSCSATTNNGTAVINNGTVIANQFNIQIFDSTASSLTAEVVRDKVLEALTLQAVEQGACTV